VKCTFKWHGQSVTEFESSLF